MQIDTTATPEQARAYITEWLAFTVRCRGHAPERWVYNGPEAFLQVHGRFFEPDLVAFPHRGVPRLCFENAYRAARRSRGRYHYCEGIAFNLIPTLHAWLIDKDGRVLDPTWEQGLAYFGVELDLNEVARSRDGGWLSLLDDWKRHFPAARGVPVLAPNAWFRETATRESDVSLRGPTDGICRP